MIKFRTQEKWGQRGLHRSWIELNTIDGKSENIKVATITQKEKCIWILGLGKELAC